MDQHAATDGRPRRAALRRITRFTSEPGSFRLSRCLARGRQRAGPRAGRPRARQVITGVETIPGSASRVYNLQADDPHTYFAAGVGVHNKGGGARGPDMAGVVSGWVAGRFELSRWIGVIWADGPDSGRYLTIIVIVDFHRHPHLQGPARPPPITTSRTSTSCIAAQQRSSHQGRQDPQAAGLHRQTGPGDGSGPAHEGGPGAAFLKLQECWQARAYEPMKKRSSCRTCTPSISGRSRP